jgi:4-amino-4-deoxy-L-arabinose transferase-like glycosyltransferase
MALIARLAWALSRPSDPASIAQLPDQREYLELADNLLHGRGLFFYDPRFDANVFAYRTPGYPLFLAACGASPRVARAAQALLDTSTVLAIYFIARRWLSPSQSWWAAALVAFNPYLVYFSGLILSETLYTDMLAWGMLFLQGRIKPEGPSAQLARKPAASPTAFASGLYDSLPSPLLGGVVLALSVLVRPSGLGLAVLLAIPAALLNRDRRGAYPRWWPLPPATTMLVLTLLALLPWAYRNCRVLGRWVWTTTNGGITAYDGFNDDATGASDQRFAARVPGLSHASEIERDQFFADAAWQWARHHPRRALELGLIKAGRMWSPVPLSAEFGRPLYRWIGGLYEVPSDLLVILGLLYGRLPRAAKVLLLFPAIYFTLVHAASVGSLRYRLPAEPPMAILAVASCSLLVASKDRYLRASPH